MSDKANNFIQIFNEIVVCSCIISLVIFTDFIPNPVDRYEYGYTLLYVVATSIGVNVIILVATILISIYNAIRQKIRKHRYTKQMKELVEKRALAAQSKDLKRGKTEVFKLEDILELSSEESEPSSSQPSSIQSCSSYESSSVDSSVASSRKEVTQTMKISAAESDKQWSVLDDGSIAMLAQMGVIAPSELLV